MNYEPITHTMCDRPLVRLPSGRDVSVPVHRYDGGDGPTVYIQAAQHGIELNGSATLRRLHGALSGGSIAGTVVVVPVVNPLAFDHRSYMMPAEYDAINSNLNRVWPGDSGGTLQERLAAAVWDVVSAADAAIDLHTGTPETLEHVRHFVGHGDARAFAEAFGTEYIITDSFVETDGDASKGTFRAAAAEADIPAITVELSNSRYVSDSSVQAGLDGIRNVLRTASVLEGRPAPPPAQTVLEREGGSVTATESGLFEPRREIAVGDPITEGEPIGSIHSPSTFERLETVTAPAGGVVYSLARGSVVVAGERVSGIGAPA